MDPQLTKIIPKTNPHFDYEYKPTEAKPNRMSFFADELRLLYLEPYKIGLRIVNTNHVGLLMANSNTEKLAIIYPDQNDCLCFEVFPGKGDHPELKRFIGLIEDTYGDRRGIGA